MNAEPRTISEAFASLNPRRALDVACGCGRLTRSLEPFCSHIVAIDSAPLMNRWMQQPRDTAVHYCRMDAGALAFAASSFHVVLERVSLHHVLDFRVVLDEMFRVSEEYVLVEEPVDDLRTEEKRNTAAARNLFLELQHAVGYRHNPHLGAEELVHEVHQRASVVVAHIERRDTPVAFEDYFSGFDGFARESGQEGYWRDRLEAFRQQLGPGLLSADDTILVLARK